jgi:hypothetical protein
MLVIELKKIENVFTFTLLQLGQKSEMYVEIINTWYSGMSVLINYSCDLIISFRVVF